MLGARSPPGPTAKIQPQPPPGSNLALQGQLRVLSARAKTPKEPSPRASHPGDCQQHHNKEEERRGDNHRDLSGMETAWGHRPHLTTLHSTPQPQPALARRCRGSWGRERLCWERP